MALSGKREAMMKKVALGIVLAACISSGARAATVQFDSADYYVAPGDTVTVQVQFVVPEGEVAPVAAVSAKVSISGGDFPGEVTTSLSDVIQATTGTYILDDSDGFDNGGTASLIAVAQGRLDVFTGVMAVLGPIVTLIVKDYFQSKE